MSLLHESEVSDMADLHDGRDREISLGTPTVLGIFFALTLVCAGFFGFGYTLGRKSTQASTIATVPEAAPSNDSFRGFKPAPGNPAVGTTGSSGSKDAAANGAGGTSTSYAGVTTAAGRTVTVPVAGKKPFDPDAEIVTEPVKAAVPVARPAAAVAASAAAAGGSAMVQVSAFRRQEDADMVASALRRKGYTVYIRQEPQDKYLHVQLGPYATKKDAEAMKDRLSADGFNSIVK